MNDRLFFLSHIILSNYQIHNDSQGEKITLNGVGITINQQYPTPNFQYPMTKFRLMGFEGEAARRFSNMLIGSAGVFSATKRTKGVDFADSQAVRVIIQKGTFCGQLAAGSAAPARAGAVRGDGQKRGKKAKAFGRPGVFRDNFFTIFRHNA